LKGAADAELKAKLENKPTIIRNDLSMALLPKVNIQRNN
jgi:hypothetical protein